MVREYSNPCVTDEEYNHKTKISVGVLAPFGTTPEAFQEIVTAKLDPSGIILISTSILTEAVEYQKEDTPGYVEGEVNALPH